MSTAGPARRPVGRSGLEISSIGLGCVTFGREIDEDDSRRVLDHAVEQGITFLDTAEAYGGGNALASRAEHYGSSEVIEATTEMYSSEMILGRWLRERGCIDRVVVCTKVSSGCRPDNIRRQLAASLERLGLDRVDVYKLHSPDADVPVAESLHALHEQVEAGRIRVIGCSNHSAEQVRAALEASAAHGLTRFAITQPPYSLADRRFEADLLPLCAGHDIAVTSYSPLAAGFLAGKYTPDRDRFPAGSRFAISPAHADIYFSERNFRVVERLRRKAAELRVPMVRLAMAWAMTNPLITSVLVGARTTAHVDNALEAGRMGLDPQVRAEMAGWD